MPPSTTDSTANIEATLGLTHTGARWRRGTWLVVLVLIIVSGTAAYLVLRARTRTPGVEYRTEVVRRGTLTISVTATGTVEPLTQVNVGTEISGIIESVSVNDNDLVRAGQILARVNTERLDAQAEQARAALRVAEAALQQSRATLLESRNTLARLEEVRGLSGGKVPSPLELEAAQATVARAEADELSKVAAIAQSRAALAAIESDVSKAIIRSPITGIVLDRQVDPGQTVAASFQTPTLFTLAEDLAQMKLSVDVDEADIGRVRLGQPATFTVDAYADRTFDSDVVGIGNLSQTSGGVVTYEAVLSVANPELLLKPGMTATAVITVTHLADVLLVPNTALRFVPDDVIDDEAQSASGRTGGGLIGALMPRPGRTGGTTSAITRQSQRVWILRDGQPVAVDVVVGATDGIWTEILSGDLPADAAVIVDSIAMGD